MNLLRIGIMVVALAIAGVVAFLIREYLQSQTVSIEEQQRLAERSEVTTVKVLVANKALPAGTVLLGAEIEGHIRWQPWPEEGIDPSWVVIREGEDGGEKRARFVGATVTRGFVASEPISSSRLLLKGESGFMAATLAPGTRAVSITINAASAVAGFIVPGSLVDVILTERWQEADPVTGAAKTRFVSEVILENVKVLAIDQNIDDLSQASVVGKTATVEVTPKEAEKLAVAKAMGQLSLTLRSLKQAEHPVSADPFTSELEVSRFLSRDAGVAVTRSPILVAKHQLEPGMLLTDADVEWKTPADDIAMDDLLVRGRFNEAGIRGALVRSSFDAGDPILESALIRTGSQGFLTAALQPGMRAISLAVTDVSGVSGYVSPGDRVDVVLTHQIADQAPDPPLTPRKFSETVLYDVRVLAIEQSVDESSGKPVIGRTATLELTPKQAEMAFLATSMGTLALALRGHGPDEPSVATRPFTSDLEVSRAAWELIRGFNRYGPGEGALPSREPPPPEPEPEPEVVVVSEPLPPPPQAPPVVRDLGKGSKRLTVRAFRGTSQSRVIVKR